MKFDQTLSESESLARETIVISQTRMSIHFALAPKLWRIKKNPTYELIAFSSVPAPSDMLCSVSLFQPLEYQNKMKKWPGTRP